jgi:hypothetical protein
VVIAFTVIGQDVLIVGVFYGGRDYEAVLTDFEQLGAASAIGKARVSNAFRSSTAICSCVTGMPPASPYLIETRNKICKSSELASAESMNE